MTGSESIEAYLDSVRNQLHHLPEDERSAILDDLGSHIHEELKSRCGEAEPTAQDVGAVLAVMDPPSAFRPDTAATTTGARPSLGNMALIFSIIGVLIFCGFIAVAAALSELGYLLSGAVLYLPVVLLEMTALIVGLFSRGDKHGKMAIVISLVTLVAMVGMSK